MSSLSWEKWFLLRLTASERSRIAFITNYNDTFYYYFLVLVIYIAIDNDSRRRPFLISSIQKTPTSSFFILVFSVSRYQMKWHLHWRVTSNTRTIKSSLSNLCSLLLIGNSKKETVTTSWENLWEIRVEHTHPHKHTVEGRKNSQ